MKIKAAIAREIGADLSVEDVELRAEKLLPHEVLIRIKACGICHTDISARDLPDETSFPFPFWPKPLILGHEGAGIVEKAGSNITHVKVGDRVMMSYHYHSDCPSPYGETYVPYNIVGTAPDGSHLHYDCNNHPLNMMHHQGSMASYSIGTAENTYKLPDDIPFEYGAPIGCGFMTGAGGVKYLLDVQPGSVIAVFGCGAVGMAAITAASDLGCSDIIAVDLDEGRLEIAKKAGATCLTNASKVDAKEAILAKYPMGVNYTFEATGVRPVIETAIDLLGVRGKCAIFGGTSDPDERSSIHTNGLVVGKQILGGLMGHGNPSDIISYVFDLIRSGKLPLEDMVKTYPFENINEAIREGSKQAIKPVIVMD